MGAITNIPTKTAAIAALTGKDILTLKQQFYRLKLQGWSSNELTPDNAEKLINSYQLHSNNEQQNTATTEQDTVEVQQQRQQAATERATMEQQRKATEQREKELEQQRQQAATEQQQIEQQREQARQELENLEQQKQQAEALRLKTDYNKVPLGVFCVVMFIINCFVFVRKNWAADLTIFYATFLICAIPCWMEFRFGSILLTIEHKELKNSFLKLLRHQWTSLIVLIPAMGFQSFNVFELCWDVVNPASNPNHIAMPYFITVFQLYGLIETVNMQKVVKK